MQKILLVILALYTSSAAAVTVLPTPVFARDFASLEIRGDERQGTSRQKIGSESPIQLVGYSSTHLNYYLVECRAWLTCRSGKTISCVSNGSWCTSTDANNRVECRAPGAGAVDRCD